MNEQLFTVAAQTFRLGGHDASTTFEARVRAAEARYIHTAGVKTTIYPAIGRYAAWAKIEAPKGGRYGGHILVMLIDEPSGGLAV